MLSQHKALRRQLDAEIVMQVAGEGVLVHLKAKLEMNVVIVDLVQEDFVLQVHEVVTAYLCSVSDQLQKCTTFIKKSTGGPAETMEGTVRNYLQGAFTFIDK